MRDDGSETTTFENGLTVCFLPVHKARHLHIVAGIRSGSIYENKTNNGITHLLEHLHLSFSSRCPKGSQLYKTFRGVGLEVNGATGSSCTLLICSLVNGDAMKASRLLAGLLQTKDFPDEIIEAEKALLATEVDELGADTQWSILNGHLFPGHSCSLPPGGRSQCIQTMRPAEIHAYNQRFYRPNNMTIFIAGDFSRGMADDVTQIFADIEAVDGEELQQPAAPAGHFPHIGPWRGNGVGASLGFRLTEPFENKDSIVSELLVDALGDVLCPLFTEIRYSTRPVYHYQIERYDACVVEMFVVHGATTRSNQHEFIRRVLSHLLTLTAGGDEHRQWILEAIDRHWHWLAYSKLSDGEAAMKCAESVFSTSKTPKLRLQEQLDVLQSLTFQDIVDFAVKHFVRDNLFVAFETRIPVTLQPSEVDLGELGRVGLCL